MLKKGKVWTTYESAKVEDPDFLYYFSSCQSWTWTKLATEPWESGILQNKYNFNGRLV